MHIFRNIAEVKGADEQPPFNNPIYSSIQPIEKRNLPASDQEQAGDPTTDDDKAYLI